MVWLARTTYQDQGGQPRTLVVRATGPAGGAPPCQHNGPRHTGKQHYQWQACGRRQPGAERSTTPLGSTLTRREQLSARPLARRWGQYPVAPGLHGGPLAGVAWASAYTADCRLLHRLAYTSSASRSKDPPLGPPSAAGVSAATHVSPSVWRSCCSMAAAMSGCSLRYFLAFSRPWPIRSSW
jgi:hypothetical protein